MLMDDKPPLDEDLLIHFGVKGMRWGHRKSSSDSGSGAPPKKPVKKKITSETIREARATHHARMTQLVLADQKVRLATTKKGKDAALKIVEKYAKQMANSDDARIANKMTRGEKTIALLVGGPLGAVVIGANAFTTRERKK
jgi:hypothetical protein